MNLIAVRTDRILPTHYRFARRLNMRTFALAAITVLCGATVLAQTPVREGDALLLDDVSAKLRNELETIDGRWFHAFDTGDGAAMDGPDPIQWTVSLS